MGEGPVILLVEDNEDDVFMIRHALRNAHVTNPLQVTRDGEAAIAYLKGEGKFTNRARYPSPALVLLDLKMPKLDGFEVLRWIRQQPTFNLLRVVVLTNSSDMREASAAYALGANSFLVKPIDFQESVRLMVVLAGQ